MSKGTIWAPEWTEVLDPVSGVTVRQLTNYKGHTHHLYFTNPGWYDNNRKMLLGSDRNNRTNLFSIDLDSGELTQLTDLEPVPLPHETSILNTAVNPKRDEAYFWYKTSVVALDLKTLEMIELWQMPKGFSKSMLNVTADGKHVCVGIYEDLSDRFRVDLHRGYVGFHEIHAANPLSRVMRIATDGSGADIVWEERSWIGHVNTSPTQPHLLTFCHEGPWEKVDNRIWGLDLNTCKAWMIRPREQNERVGHEYWHADGEYVGYHGHGQGNTKFFGRVRWDNTDRTEVDFPFETGHIHSNDFHMIVGDGGKVVRLWRWTGSGFEGPRVLAEHRSSMHIQEVHVHPRFSPDGAYVVYTSDVSGYGNVYMVRMPDFDSLPPVESQAAV